MSALEAILSLALGGLAALLHLGATWTRAAMSARGWIVLAMISLPVALAAPALCLFAAMAFAPLFAWAPVLSFWWVRSFALVRVARP